jgi:uncharacterized phage protein (TIGR02218 family)
LKTLTPAFEANLSGDALTLCYCWRIHRKDGVIFGFTDHDEQVICDGTTFIATTGILTTQISRALGLSVDNLEVTGAIDDEIITVADIESGLYDGAAVDIYIVNWSAPDQFSHEATGTLGNLTQVDSGFQTEFRSLSHVLNQKTGRVYQSACDAVLGDARCGVNLTSPAYRTVTTIEAVNGQTVTVGDLSAFGDEWFTLGTLVDAAGGSHQIMTQRGSAITLWLESAIPLAVGSSVTLIAGCKQDSTTCRVKFANITNFQGFPFMPGNDALTSYPIRGSQDYNGGSLFK